MNDPFVISVIVFREFKELVAAWFLVQREEERGWYNVMSWFLATFPVTSRIQISDGWRKRWGAFSKLHN